MIMTELLLAKKNEVTFDCYHQPFVISPGYEREDAWYFVEVSSHSVPWPTRVNSVNWEFKHRSK